jgi:hypothetical protein
MTKRPINTLPILSPGKNPDLDLDRIDALENSIDRHPLMMATACLARDVPVGWSGCVRRPPD